MINEGSASASEIVAIALREMKGSKIVGTTSFGKGKIQEIINYYDGSSLKLSTAKWLSPSGICIDISGIEPDYNVEITDRDIDLGKDRLDMRVRATPLGSVGSLMGKVPLAGKTLEKGKETVLSTDFIARGPISNPEVKLAVVDKIKPGKENNQE